ncbi:MAG: hypothetical protein QM765_41335 [Myxococcales bacterium]
MANSGARFDGSTSVFGFSPSRTSAPPRMARMESVGGEDRGADQVGHAAADAALDDL